MATTAKDLQARVRVTKDKFNSGLAKFGNDKLNINTTSAKGLEKAIGVISKFIIKVQGKVNEIFYGKFTSGKEPTNFAKRLLNKGVINLLELIATVDFCNILNYSLNKLPGGGQLFDPNKEPDSTTSFIDRKKFFIQKKAYDTQQFIDKYYREYADSNNPQSKVGLFVLIQEIKQSLGDTLLSPTEGINDPLLKENFPQLGTASNFLQNGLGLLDRYTDVRQISNSDVQRILSTIDKIRQYCIIIQGLNNPKNLIGLIDSSLNGAIQRELADISNLIINPDKAVNVLSSIIKTVNTINNIAQKVLGYITTLQFITRTCIFLIRIFNIVISFLLAIPIWGLPEGGTLKLADTLNKINEFIKKLILRLEQISAVINLIAILATSIVAAIQNVIGKLRIVLLNLESCQTKEVGLINEIKDTINNLTKTSDQLQEFLNRYNDQQQESQTRFGNYTISIVTEQVVDEGINLRRRYGIAKDANQYVVVQSTPTFASLDLIIINEVKVLLASKGLVNVGLSSLSPENQVLVSDVSKALGIDDVSLDNISLDLAGIESYNTETDELGINEFINNLPGGRAMRRRIRRKMIENATKLGADLKRTDPEGKYTSSIQRQQTTQINKLEIEDLQDKIKTWQKEIALAATQGPIGLIVIRDRTKKIKDAENKIQQLRQG
jgi:hypothetical protein